MSLWIFFSLITYILIQNLLVLKKYSPNEITGLFKEIKIDST